MYFKAIIRACSNISLLYFGVCLNPLTLSILVSFWTWLYRLLTFRTPPSSSKAYAYIWGLPYLYIHSSNPGRLADTCYHLSGTSKKPITIPHTSLGCHGNDAQRCSRMWAQWAFFLCRDASTSSLWYMTQVIYVCAIIMRENWKSAVSQKVNAGRKGHTKNIIPNT